MERTDDEMRRRVKARGETRSRADGATQNTRTRDNGQRNPLARGRGGKVL